ncbi:hypothetical protein KEM52_000565, partial [Ascosphaera acerosa]
TPRYACPGRAARSSGGDGGVPGQDDSDVRWDVVKLQVNRFTHDEWPPVHQQPLRSFSPGEELSHSHVTALAWSDAGLGPFGRPVLAVLTSNLLLSLWAAEDGNARWRRLVVVNRLLRKHFAPLMGGDRLLLQRRQRVRCFAWAPRQPPADAGRHAQGTSDGGPTSATATAATAAAASASSYLVVANDERELLFLRVDAVRRSTAGTQRLTLQVVSNISAMSDGGDGTGNGDGDGEETSNRQEPQPDVGSAGSSYASAIATCLSRISDVVWSAWHSVSESPSDRQSYVAFIRDNQLRLCHIRQVSDGGLDVKCLAAAESRTEAAAPLAAISAPLVWTTVRQAVSSPYAIAATRSNQGFQAGDCLFAPLCNGAGYYRVQVVRGNTPRIASVTLRPLKAYQGAGTVISKQRTAWFLPGLDAANAEAAAVSSATNDQCAYYAFHYGRMAILNDEPGGDSSEDPSRSRAPQLQLQAALQRRIDAVRERFDLDYDLGGKSVARIWGLARTAPTRYGPEQRDSGPDGCAAAARAEYLLACVTLHPTGMPEHVQPSATVMHLLFAGPADCGEGLQAAASQQVANVPETAPPTSSAASPAIPARLIPPVTRDAATKAQRRARILSRLRASLGQDPEHAAAIAQHDPLARMVLYAHACCSVVEHRSAEEAPWLLALLRLMTGLSFATEEAAICNEATAGARTVIPARPADSSMAALTFERCVVCGSGIPWQSAETCRCEKGHRFCEATNSFPGLQLHGTHTAPTSQLT